jgi:phytoene dehydrogenase-like protein
VIAVGDPRTTDARRVLVVGAGHHGLVAGVHAALAGCEVVVVERGPRPGGATTSGEDTLPGFVHDRCAGFLPLTLASPAFDGLEVRERLTWIDPPVAMAHPFSDGSAIVLHRSLAETVASLEAMAPGAGGRWEVFVRPLVHRPGPLLRAALRPFPPVREAGALARQLGPGVVDLARRMLGPAARSGRALLGDARAAAWFAGSVGHSDLGPGALGGGALAIVLLVLGHVVGWPFPAGGVGRLTDALVARLEELGGRVVCGAEVERILVAGGRARGVALTSGERMEADAVLSTVSAGVLGRLLPPDALAPRLTRRLTRWRYGTGTFKVDYALAGPVAWTAPAAREAGVVHVADAEGVLVVGQQSLHDPSRAPAGRHTLYVYTHVDASLPDDAVLARLEERLTAFAPGFPGLVLARSVRSPATLERENPSLVGGDLGGGSYALDQQLLLRPAPSLLRGRTPLPGLYVAGASVHPGGGVHGVSGRAAARALVADAATRRFRG